jgi:hypothetical protein
MTEPHTDCCASCGLPKPVTAYHLSFCVPAGVYRDIIFAHTPEEALERAKNRADTENIPAENFDPVADSFCIQQIIVEHPDGLVVTCLPKVTLRKVSDFKSLSFGR